MKATLRVMDRLFDADVRYQPNDKGGELVLSARLEPPYPPRGEIALQVFLDGHRLQSTTAEMPDTDNGYPVWLEQRIELSFKRVPD